MSRKDYVAIAEAANQGALDPEWIERHAPKPPPNCPRCGGEREFDGDRRHAACRFCGLTEELTG